MDGLVFFLGPSPEAFSWSLTISTTGYCSWYRDASATFPCIEACRHAGGRLSSGEALAGGGSEIPVQGAGC